MSATYQFRVNTGLNGSVSLPANPDAVGPCQPAVQYTAVNGIVTVNAQDVPAALRAGWTAMVNADGSVPNVSTAYESNVGLYLAID